MARPTIYSKAFCEKLINHMAKGLSFESFAGAISVSRRVLYDWEIKYPEFLHAKEIGTEKSRIFWEKAGIQGAFAQKVKDPNTDRGYRIQKTPIIPSVWIFNMKNRFQWRDRQPDESEVVVNNLVGKSDSELDARIKELMSKYEPK